MDAFSEAIGVEDAGTEEGAADEVKSQMTYIAKVTIKNTMQNELEIDPR